MFNGIINEYDEDEYEPYDDDEDIDESELDAVIGDEGNEYEGNFVGDDAGPDRAVLQSVNKNDANIDSVEKDLKSRMMSFPKEGDGNPPDVTEVMSAMLNPTPMTPDNVTMMEPTLITLENDSFIEGTIYKKGTRLEILT